ncbi:hypothetical protein B0J17DRAFT_685839 [Rhizoctonia solani]|nr:hypothetical protein B0J17DRAFT_691938 [Rhizoctonia solani]KAH7320368.1 hypothetical protein B0J17DRAFT_685839 [Rhizoctonia solani]
MSTDFYQALDLWWLTFVCHTLPLPSHSAFLARSKKRLHGLRLPVRSTPHRPKLRSRGLLPTSRTNHLGNSHGQVYEGWINCPNPRIQAEAPKHTLPPSLYSHSHRLRISIDQRRRVNRIFLGCLLIHQLRPKFVIRPAG